jgi:hypothetical protein
MLRQDYLFMALLMFILLLMHHWLGGHHFRH